MSHVPTVLESGLVLCTVSTKSQEKTTVFLYMINVPTLKEIGLVPILIEKIIICVYIINVLTWEKSGLVVTLRVQEYREDISIVIYFRRPEVSRKSLEKGVGLNIWSYILTCLGGILNRRFNR